MKFLICVMLALAASGVSAALRPAAAAAQTTTDLGGARNLAMAGGMGNDYAYGYHASTVYEGFFRGIADGIRSLGLGRLLSSEAMLNEAEAYRRGLDNYKTEVDTYFAARQMNRQSRALERGHRPTGEDYARFARMGIPRMLSPSELDPLSGQVAWPMLLRTSNFHAQRESLNQVFARWAGSGTLEYDDVMTVRQTTDVMLDKLNAGVRTLPPAQYMMARRFLESMSFEVSQPTRQLNGRALANASQPTLRW